MAAGMRLGLGALGCTAQLVGFTLGIYVFYDWNEMEPWTWMFRKYQFPCFDIIDCVQRRFT